MGFGKSVFTGTVVVSMFLGFSISILLIIFMNQDRLVISTSSATPTHSAEHVQPVQEDVADTINPLAHWRRRQKALRELETNPVTLAFGVEQSYLFTQLRTQDTLWAWRIFGATATALSSFTALGWVRPILAAVGAASPVLGGCFPASEDGGGR